MDIRTRRFQLESWTGRQRVVTYYIVKTLGEVERTFVDRVAVFTEKG